MSDKEYGKLTLINNTDLSTHPRCKHGPSLLFCKELGGNHGTKKFFACSAYRNRKDCDFYQSFEDKLSQARRFRLSEAAKEFVRSNNYSESFKSVREFKNKTREKLDNGSSIEGFSKQSDVYDSDGLKFCQTCDKVAASDCIEHKSVMLNQADLCFPTKIVKAKSSDKKEAQYFFSNSATEFFKGLIKKLEFTNVLCIGCPSVYESLPNDLISRSMLLDIDPRFLSFYSSEQFLWFNFFNGHFFHGESDAVKFRDFLISCEKLLIILDPPFGAKTELISHSLDRVINQLEMFSISASASIVWVFPYFMERQILQSRNDLAMSDYKVTYSGHARFNGAESGRKLGSPVRVFTSIPLNILELPVNEGYRNCHICQRWVSLENKHCYECGKCTSKDGRTYVHCTLCKRCVKPTYTHCSKCGTCNLPEHKCGDITNRSEVVYKSNEKRKDHKRHKNNRKKMRKH